MITLDELGAPATPAAARKAKAEQSLIKNGRYSLGGKSYQRVTNFCKILDDTFALGNWQQRKVARGIANRPDLAALVLAIPPEDDDKALKDQLDKLVEEAKRHAGSSVGANMGTALHAFCERADLGEPLTLPEPHASDVAAYRAMLERY